MGRAPPPAGSIIHGTSGALDIPRGTVLDSNTIITLPLEKNQKQSPYSVRGAGRCLPPPYHYRRRYFVHPILSGRVSHKNRPAFCNAGPQMSAHSAANRSAFPFFCSFLPLRNFAFCIPGPNSTWRPKWASGFCPNRSGNILPAGVPRHIPCA